LTEELERQGILQKEDTSVGGWKPGWQKKYEIGATFPKGRMPLPASQADASTIRKSANTPVEAKPSMQAMQPLAPRPKRHVPLAPQGRRQGWQAPPRLVRAVQAGRQPAALAVLQAAVVAPAAALAERDDYTQDVINGIKGLRAMLPSTTHLIPNISATPNGIMAMSFGSSISQDRRIILPGGRIDVSGSKVVIAVSKKSRQTVIRVTAFLQTEFPFGGKVGGVLYSLVGLIPRVIKSLPGSVVITS
jgi:hypothetical protein